MEKHFKEAGIYKELLTFLSWREENIGYKIITENDKELVIDA